MLLLHNLEQNQHQPQPEYHPNIHPMTKQYQENGFRNQSSGIHKTDEKNTSISHANHTLLCR
uniref:Uncharacterized protein n=1 Tax=Arundo donax TaxID=35708 RepID=A0A0A8Y837_ARUDO